MIATAAHQRVFGSYPYLDLVILRILAVGWVLFTMIFEMPAVIDSTYVLPERLWAPLPVLKILMLPMGWGSWHTIPSPELMHIVWWISIVSGIFAFAGFRTNTSLFVFTIGNVFMQAFIYSFGEMHHREAVMMVALLALTLSPCGRHFSVDARMGSGFNPWLDSPSASATESPFARWPLVFLQVFFALMYLSASIAKHHESGLEWANGFTLQAVLVTDGTRWDSPLALWLSQFHYFIWAMQVVVMMFQGTFWLCVIFPRLRWIYVPIGLAFHIGILLTVKAPFYTWILLYTVFIPWTSVGEIVRGERKFRQLFS